MSSVRTMWCISKNNVEVPAREEGWFKRCRDHGHVISKNNVEVLAREEGWFKRCRDHGFFPLSSVRTMWKC